MNLNRGQFMALSAGKSIIVKTMSLDLGEDVSSQEPFGRTFLGTYRTQDFRHGGLNNHFILRIEDICSHKGEVCLKGWLVPRAEGAAPSLGKNPTGARDPSLGVFSWGYATSAPGCCE
jgi:hypothetical protein